MILGAEQIDPRSVRPGVAGVHTWSGVWQSVCRGLVFVLVSGKRQAKQGSQINTDYTEKQIKPQITRKGSEVMALRARIDNNLARNAIPILLSV